MGRVLTDSGRNDGRTERRKGCSATDLISSTDLPVRDPCSRNQSVAVIPSFLPSVFPSFRPSESERFFVSITVGGFAFGLIGVERIPHALMLILAAGVFMQWTNALEEASRRGARAVRLKQFSPRGV